MRAIRLNQSSLDELERMLIKYSGGFVHLALPGGNLGDHLIYYGLRTALRQYNISFDEIYMDRPMTGDTLFIAGCGGYCKFWNGIMEWLQPYLKSFKKVYILPSTFDKAFKPVRDFLLNLPSNTEVYCRERTSYEFVSEILVSRAHLSKDSAFYIPWEKYMNQGRGVLHSFRTDRERSHRVRMPDDNIDVSLTSADEEDMLRRIASYREIHTDRAHVAISAVMLGKNTYIYDCGYFKLKAIYDYSLSEQPNAKFVDTFPWNINFLNWYSRSNFNRIKRNIKIGGRRIKRYMMQSDQF